MQPTKHRFLWFGLALALIILDQLSKVLATSHLELHQPQELWPLLNLTLVYNSGAAFSLLSQAGGWQRWFFLVLSLTISILLSFWLLRLQRREIWTAAALSLILAGAIGNLIDRAIYGYVIDFIDFFYPTTKDCLPLFMASGENTCHWPTFNIADSAISVGAVLLLISQFFETRQNAEP
ncbi:MAG TPA: signal peptidase II [Gammaproteobacteria bacterium]